ncbi:type III effector protein [Dickeya fangzhongdai]|uniref:type III effector protein n=1 Tax=Dickeya fangzhongdai TaxID=1778540 RepID=UPI001F13AD80|nr:type III effector protein [Dickeya fangzhongdai]UMB79230.1 type III effector protein [Dickeya fangzhongdai]
MADINITLSIPSAGLNGGLGGVGGADNLNSGLGNNGLSGKKSTAQENQLLEALAVVLTALLPSLLNNNGGQGGGDSPLGRTSDALGGGGAGNALGGGQGNGLGGGLENGLGSGSGGLADGLGASGGQGQNGLTDILTKLLDLLMPKDGAQGGQGLQGGGLGGAGGSDGASGAQGAGGAGGASGTGGLEDLSKSLLQDTGESSLGNGISPTQDGGGQISDNPLLKILLALVALLMESQKNQFGQPQGGSGGAAPVSGSSAGGSSAPSVGNATGATPAVGGGAAPILSGAAPETGGIAAAGAGNNAGELADGKGQPGLTPASDAIGADSGKTTV